MMILHYLGLDHIGHLAGPQSPLVPPKLEEMDNVVKRIYESVSIQVLGFLLFVHWVSLTTNTRVQRPGPK